jgi:hypothetical protein
MVGRKRRGKEDMDIISSECVPFQEEYEEREHICSGGQGAGGGIFRQLSVLGGIGIDMGEKCCRGVGAGMRVRRDGEAYNHLPFVHTVGEGR